MVNATSSTHRIVVGIGAGDTDLAPLRWALDEAARRNGPLDVVYAWDVPYDVSPTGLPGLALDAAPFEARAKEVLDDAVLHMPADVRRSVPDLHLRPVQDRPAHALLEASVDAELLVVGKRGLGPLRGLLGSVSHQCVHHAPCPVVVVPRHWPAARVPRRIVVGVDGSHGSAVALRWALDECERCDAELTVVHSWNTPYPVEPWGFVITPRDREQFETNARDLIDGMVDVEVVHGAARPRALAALAVDDASGPALVESCADADLLVVGSRGRGGFAALLVGSTSLHCLHHAAPPVVVVPTPR